jgi:Stage II sporulation protein E (SpoIIE)
MPLGLMPGMSYEEKETVLYKGDSALLYTDGLVEAHDPHGEMFGFPRLRALVAQHGEERRVLGDILIRGALLLCWAGLATGGRHNPPYPGALRETRLKLRERTTTSFECRGRTRWALLGGSILG